MSAQECDLMAHLLARSVALGAQLVAVEPGVDCRGYLVRAIFGGVVSGRSTVFDFEVRNVLGAPRHHLWSD
jgi:hypothetical protein